MNQLSIRLRRARWVAGACVLILCACAPGAAPAVPTTAAVSSTTVSLAPTTAAVSSTSAASTPTRTRAPTATPVPLTAPGGPDIESFMLVPGDLPEGYTANDVEIEFEQEHEGIVSITTHFMDGNDGVIENELAITAGGRPFSLEREEPSLALADAPTVGDDSRAFLGRTEDGRPWASLWFNKGNAAVRLELEGGSGVATIDNAVKLARIVESRLLSPVPPVALISFPDKLDQAAYGKYFKSITLGTYDYGSGSTEVTPTTNFELSPEFMICGSMEMRTAAPNLTVGLYDTMSQTYRLKHIHPEEFATTIPRCEFPHDLPEGSYEYRVAVGEAWVAALPFQVSTNVVEAQPEVTAAAEATSAGSEQETGLTATPLPVATAPLTAPGGIKIEDYLLTSGDLPPGYKLSNIITQIETTWLDARLSARAVLVGPTSYVSSYVGVAAQPFGPDALEKYGLGSLAAEAPVIGEGSKAYKSKAEGKTSDVTIVFYKGNALVEIKLSGASEVVTLDLVVKLARIIEARLPAMLAAPAPITLPENLDQAAYSRYFKSITLGTMKQGVTGMVPTTTLASSSIICTEGVAVTRVPRYSFGVYRVESHTFILKESDAQELMSGSTLKCSAPGIVPLPTGNYEYRVAVGDVLVAVLPFEVR